MKLLVSLKTLELESYLKFTNSFLIGLKDYCVNYHEASTNEIKNLLEKYPQIELFISINKNIFNEDIKDLKLKLQELAKLKIKGILFYDLSILNLVKELNLDIPLVIHQEHMITNYNICNYYDDKEVEYAYLSSDITTEEILEIANKTKIKLMVFLVGNILITHSKRNLISNYYEYYQEDNKCDKHILKEKNKEEKYIIEETKQGTNILTYHILNGARAFLTLKDKICYGVFDSNIRVDLEEKDFLKILELYSLVLERKISEEDFLKEIAKVSNNYHEGFFNKKTIYKVK